LSTLLLDGARRDLIQGTGTVVAVAGGATLQTASGKHAPAPSFVGQTFAPGDTLTTDSTGTVTVAFPDSLVVQLGPHNQLRQTQSTAYRTGTRSHWFQTGSGLVRTYNPKDVVVALVNASGSGAIGGGSLAFGGKAPARAQELARYSTQPSVFERIETVLWWPLDTALGRLGITTRGTFQGTDSQRRDECRAVCRGLMTILPTAAGLPEGSLIPVESLSLPETLLPQAQRSIAGPYIVLARRGSSFLAQVTARDSEGTTFTVTTQGVQEKRKK
jgi:hypothetical protein